MANPNDFNSFDPTTPTAEEEIIKMIRSLERRLRSLESLKDQSPKLLECSFGVDNDDQDYDIFY
jgi:uncharacterized coiled-coil DUF342 family protein